MSGLMSSLKLSAYPIAALVLFLVAFALIMWRVFSRKNAPELDLAAQIPLTDSVVTARVGEDHTNGRKN